MKWLSDIITSEHRRQVKLEPLFNAHVTHAYKWLEGKNVKLSRYAM
jgi:hypothetical protein